MNFLVHKRCQIQRNSITVSDPRDPHCPPQPTDLMANADIVSFLNHLGLIKPVTPCCLWLNEFDLIISTDCPEPGDRVTVRCFNLDYAQCEWSFRLDKPLEPWNDSFGSFGNPCEPASKSQSLAAWFYEASKRDVFLTIEPGLRLIGEDANLQSYIFMLKHPLTGFTGLEPVPFDHLPDVQPN